MRIYSLYIVTVLLVYSSFYLTISSKKSYPTIIYYIYRLPAGPKLIMNHRRHLGTAPSSSKVSSCPQSSPRVLEFSSRAIYYVYRWQPEA